MHHLLQKGLYFKYKHVIHLDPTWGVSKMYMNARTTKAKFTLNYYEQAESRLNNSVRASLVTAYDRCKANRRCNWGIVGEFIDKIRYVAVVNLLFER